MSYDWISFTTDYGLADGFVAACVGVMARISPALRVLHVTHQVPPQDVRRGAVVLAQTAPYLPPSVHLAVVDPGVGTERRPIVVVAAGGLLVGPDNGLLVPAAAALGGIEAAYRLSDPEYRLSTVSATFHGRDVFAPAAAHLAAGVPPDRFGAALDPDSLVRLPEPKTVVENGKLTTEVMAVDRFGNLQLAATELPDLGATVRVRVCDRSVEATLGRTFADADPGALIVYLNSHGHAAVAVNGGSAAASLGATTGTTVTLSAQDAR